MTDANKKIIEAMAKEIKRLKGLLRETHYCITYTTEVRNIECMHAHPGPDEFCAACCARALSTKIAKELEK